MVEDEADVLGLNIQHLEKQGYTVLGVGTLAEARAAMGDLLPDLILLDVMLPDGSGYDFCAEIRPHTSAPIVFLTAKDQSEQVVQGLSGGGDDYITKPYDLNVLSARVMAQLRRSGLHGAGRIDMPPLSVNLQNGSATLNGAGVALAQKELQILAYLMSRIGRECLISELYEAIWDEPSNNSTHTVTAHVSSIRNKLKLDAESPFEIRSTKNKGYIFLKINYE